MLSKNEPVPPMFQYDEETPKQPASEAIRPRMSRTIPK